MIQRIELWDFESHEHTVLEDISPALNLFCGVSNSGKTSIVRALKLAAYNEFDPRSVRVGATKCVVQVDTERGRVKVTRGPKHNAWETTKTGQKTQYFDKVGVNVVKDAAEIIGLNIVTLGDVNVPVNIMDQLESHFMLAGVGGKDASGSMRAQIVDEISGLSGIEGIIKDVSLDHHRYGREIKETEKQMETTRSQLHPETDLNAEDSILTSAEKELTDHATMLNLTVEGDDLVSKGSGISQQIGDMNRRMAAIPNTDLALQEIVRADDMTNRAVAASSLHRDGVIAEDRTDGINKTLAGIPDVQMATSFINEADTAGRVLTNAVDIHKRWMIASQDMAVKRKRDNEIGEALVSDIEVGKAQDAVVLCDAAAKLLNEAQRMTAGIMGLRQRIEGKDRELGEAEKERDEILASVKTCPLTLKAVSKECMEGGTV
jgi:hypothetical protein